MDRNKFKVNQRVYVLHSNQPEYYREGDWATLSHRDCDGDWWGWVERNRDQGRMCLTELGGIITPEENVIVRG